MGEIVISLKSDNQGLITLAYNPVFYLKIKYINIQHHYICDKMALGRIELLYVLTNKVIANGLTKALTHIKFYESSSK